MVRLARLVAVTALGGAVLLAGGPTWANPYDDPSGDLTGLAAGGNPTCAKRLGNNSYSCTVKSSTGGNFPDTYVFTRPGTVSSKFDLTPAALGATIGCACAPSGTFAEPVFNRSLTFVCVGTGDPTGDPYDIAFEGQVTTTGIVQGKVTNASGLTFVFKCTKD